LEAVEKKVNNNSNMNSDSNVNSNANSNFAPQSNSKEEKRELIRAPKSR
jgi:hypothetical protein